MIMLLNDKVEVKRFLKALMRKKTKRQRKSEFDTTNFSLKTYLKELEGYRVKIELPDHKE